MRLSRKLLIISVLIIWCSTVIKYDVIARGRGGGSRGGGRGGSRSGGSRSGSRASRSGSSARTSRVGSRIASRTMNAQSRFRIARNSRPSSSSQFRSSGLGAGAAIGSGGLGLGGAALAAANAIPSTTELIRTSNQFLLSTTSTKSTESASPLPTTTAVPLSELIRRFKTIEGKYLTEEEMHEYIRDAKKWGLSPFKILAYMIRYFAADKIARHLHFKKIDSLTAGFNRQNPEWYWGFRISPTIYEVDRQLCRNNNTYVDGIKFPYFHCPLVTFDPTETECCSDEASEEKHYEYCCAPTAKTKTRRFFKELSLFIEFNILNYIWVWISAILFMILLCIVFNNFCKKNSFKKVRNTKVFTCCGSVYAYLYEQAVWLFNRVFRRRGTNDGKTEELNEGSPTQRELAPNEKFFEKYDLNGNGLLDEDEVEIMLKDLGLENQIPAEHAVEILQDWDFNKIVKK